METLTKDKSPGECQAAAADSTTTTIADVLQYNVAAAAVAATPETTQQQVSSSTAATTATTTKHGGSPPTASNSSANNKLKLQQQQQQQQHYQFRAPQQFVKHKKPASALTKKNKTWNKRQNKTAKQLQQQQLQTCNIAVAQQIVGVVGAGGGVATCNLPATKADLENIQNLKNQLGGGSGSHHYYHHHHGGGGGGGGTHHRLSIAGGNGGGGGITEARTGAGNGLPALVGGLEKLGYGHGHLKQQLYKKMLAHRGHHHHVLCAGAAHNTLGGVANAACCLLNGCNAQNGGKDAGNVVSGVGASGVNAANAAASALHYCCSRSKFFLPDKRPRKEIIIPPTKFLLGGNISDPLNLNSLQNETSNASSNNNTPATTPRQSPITTPPKVEVIIPPNIHDPLHLLDPVDSMEYEKQLTSPMKRGGRGLMKSHHKHRHRKNRKRRRYESQNSLTLELEETTALANSTLTTDSTTTTISMTTKSLSLATTLDSSSSNNSSVASLTAVAAAAAAGLSTTDATVEQPSGEQAQNEERVISPVAIALRSSERRLRSSTLSPNAQQHVANNNSDELLATNIASDMLPKERARADLRLELNCSASSSTCGSLSSSLGAASGGGGGRKRKISESNNSQKNKKFHRHDSMDKIVSPVVPQPGAWKRPPRLVPSGARKPTRRSTSVSEPEVLSPADELGKTLIFEGITAEGARVDTPELNKIETISDVGVGSPLSTTSGATSVAAGEQDSLADNSAGDNSNALSAITDENSTNVAITAAAATPTTTTTNAVATATSTTATTKTIATLTKMPKFRADGAKYRYGNYDRYAGFRQLNEFMDVRLQVFERHLELFQNKDILDIGCNVGHMTITVARNLAPKSILGIDIDKELVARARRNLAMYVRIPPATAPVRKEERVAQTASEPPENSTPSKAKKTRRKRKSRQTKVALLPPLPAHLHEMHHHHHHTRHQHQHMHQHHHHHHHHLHHYHQQHQQLIAQQQQALAQQQQQQLQQKRQLHVPAAELFPVAFPLTYGGVPTSSTAAQTAEVASSPARTGSTPGHPSNHSTHSAGTTTCQASGAHAKCKNDFPRNVYFRQTNYVLKDESLLCNDTQQYDLILCLSVTKWIHLNFGDAGLKLAFKRMFNQLRPGGKLILEAQNWASYKKKKNLTEDIYNNYSNIEFFPNKFHEYLLSSEVGFSHSYTLGVPRHLNKGFCRPIQLYAKGDYTPNHVRWSDAYYPQTPYEAYRGIYATMPPRPAGMAYTLSSSRSQTYDTPHYTGGTSGPYSCRQTPMHQPTSQYYNPLETDSYQPSYDMEYLNHMYVFASPLYQTVWSPPASLRNSSSHTPVFGSVREAELDGDGSVGGGGGSYHRHVYPPNDDTSSPNANAGGAFSSIRDPDTDDSNQLPASSVQHVYATHCGESSSSPQVLHHHDSETIDGLMLDEEPVVASGGSASDLNDA